MWCPPPLAALFLSPTLLSVGIGTISDGGGGGGGGDNDEHAGGQLRQQPVVDGGGDEMRILCLHGAAQSGAIFRSKIGGARRKLERVYELDFLDGPVLLEGDVERSPSPSGKDGNGKDGNDDRGSVGDGEASSQPTRAWWRRDGEGRHVGVREAFDYIRTKTRGRNYDAVIGFSQGGTIGTALALTGTVPGIRAVVTAGAPHVEDAFVEAGRIATEWGGGSGDGDGNHGGDDAYRRGLEIPKLHMAGERDAMISVESTRALSERGGSGIVEVHDQGHLFPTRAARVNRVLDFLEEALAPKPQQG